ncbi:hypothetical protein LTR78_005389 [Recurvomyces mirabilis]|uniref:Uncharacterized protein n=1 Tax=Recurvomyces mirabilis TaxID=574656 RepID=A0AAE1C1Q4_9PEZI|nr:hypothetical protein LTR78_005389 [Recurvomyces mirabilis]KAK5152704.1 hypothetical protein LTS14_008238 [Recurvomyces mirabilis]
MFFVQTLLATLATASALAPPSLPPTSITSLDQTNLTTQATYYQGGAPSAACGLPVSSGVLVPNTCHQALVYGIGVQQLEDYKCTYTIYQGSKNCGDDATGVTNVTVPKGMDSTCVDAGVYDGGNLVHGLTFSYAV